VLLNKYKIEEILVDIVKIGAYNRLLTVMVW